MKWEKITLEKLKDFFTSEMNFMDFYEITMDCCKHS